MGTPSKLDRGRDIVSIPTHNLNLLRFGEEDLHELPHKWWRS